MTISSVDLKQEGTSLSGSGDDLDGLKRSYTANYRVVTDDPTTSPKAIEAHFKATATLPWYGRSWRWTGTNSNDSDSTAICKKLEISHRPKSAGVFDVEAMFEPKDGSEKNKEQPNNSDGSNSDDPLEWREQISIGYTQITEPVMLAIFDGFTTGAGGDTRTNGTNALQRGLTYIPQNSALIPYDPLPEREIDLKVIRMTSNIPFFNSNLYDGWISTVNNDPVNINKPNLGVFVSIDPFKGRLKAVNASSDFQNGQAFVRREVEIWVHPKGWRGRLADMGHAARATQAADTGFVSPGDLINKPGRAEQITIKDKDDFPMTAPVPLDGFGRPLRTDQPSRNVWTNWIYYDERQWTGTVDKW